MPALSGLVVLTPRDVEIDEVLVARRCRDVVVEEPRDPGASSNTASASP